MFEFIKDLLGRNAETERPADQVEAKTPTEETNGSAGEAEPKDNSKESTPASATEAKPKAKIYNLIIVDESGSMHHLREVTMSGVNETIQTIKLAQEELKETQQHFLTLVTFDSRGGDRPDVRELTSAEPISKVGEFTDYMPNGCTPLYDAMGISLDKLYNMIKDDEDATGCVTVLTDGLENSSHIWRVDALRRLIDKLKELGWSFSYMGSAHNVKDVADLLSIDNVVEFRHDLMGASSTWRRERSSKLAYMRRMQEMYDADCAYAMSRDEKRRRKRDMASSYYVNRVTPENLDGIANDENNIIVRWGETQGLSGNTYTIAVGNHSISALSSGVDQLLDYAEQNPGKLFYVTKLDKMWVPDQAVVHLFDRAVEMENIYLPKEYWEILGLKQFI